MLLSCLGVVAFIALEVRGVEKVITAPGVEGQWKVTTSGYPSITASVDDTLVFNYDAMHDVVKMASPGCNTTGNTVLAGNDHGGGTGDATHCCTNKYTYTITAADATAGSIYFACS